MSTQTFSRILGACSLAFFLLWPSAARVFAGPGPDYWQRMQQVRTEQQAKQLKPGDTMALVCPKCRTVAIMEYRESHPNGKAAPRSVEVGARHSCGECAGTITSVRGKVSGEMQHNCSKCGSGAAFCTATKQSP